MKRDYESIGFMYMKWISTCKQAGLMGKLPEDRGFIGLLEDNVVTTSLSLLPSPIQVD